MINFYTKIKQEKRLNPNFSKHKIHVPMRMLVCTASGGGKTNLIMNLLVLLNNTLHKIIICTKAEEPLYTLLLEKLKKDNVEIYYNGQVPDFEKMNNNENGLIIFDDLVLDKNKKIGELFIRGRKLGYSSIFISQSFYQTDKIIRQNCNYIILGRGLQNRDLNMILSEFALNISKDELLQLYNECTREHMNFLFLDLQERNIRHNFLDILKNY